jgi:hydroxymethylpyrimidine pyrophosphatase-like HAD family hydrolase
MGKSFKKELLSIKNTILWAESQDISTLRDFFERRASLPLLAIGSGGSFSACHYASLLYENRYTFSKALTPLDFFYSKQLIPNSKILFISASGKNTDIQFAFKKSQDFGSKIIGNLSMKNKNPLMEMSKEVFNSFSANYELPTGKDGFLATNSLISFFVLLYRSFDENESESGIHQKLSAFKSDSYIQEYLYFSNIVQKKLNFTVLYGGWGLPVAFDIESKFTEAALGAVQIADYRNFGHGRHHWFDKRKESSSIIAIVTPQERKIAEKTLSLMPEEIPRILIETEDKSSLGSLDLLIKSFYLVSAIGDIRKIDPGRPGVPDFGSKLYNLKYSSFYKKSEKKIDSKTKAILQKAHVSKIDDLSPAEINLWSDAYDSFVKKIQIPSYSSLVFDYDGTLSPVDVKNRHKNELSSEVKKIFITLLTYNIKIGVVTGRGKSIKELLRNSIPQKYWTQIYVGYYNGAEMGLLKDDSVPNTSLNYDTSLALIKNSLLKDFFINEEKFEVDMRPYQLTIKAKTQNDFNRIKNICNHIILVNRLSNVIILESSHSLDIIVRPIASKLNIIEKYFKEEDVLCIGDKGCVPGNDFELLSTPFSLSVDELSYHPDSCWNLIPTEQRNYDGLLYYLNCIQINKDHFKIVIDK